MGPCQPHLGARVHRCGCSLPGLTRFTVFRREGTDMNHQNEFYQSARVTAITNLAYFARMAWSLRYLHKIVIQINWLNG